MKEKTKRGLAELTILEGAVENTNEAFITIDTDHTVIFFNRAAEKIFGYDRREVMGKDLNMILGPECSPGHRRAVSRYLGSRQPTLIGHETEFKALRKNGETFPASISFSVAQVEDRLYFTGIVRDVSETKALQKEVLETEQLATLGRLVAEIIHEIKNPLMIIGSYARQLTKTLTDQKDLGKLEIMANEVKRLEDLLAELKDLYIPRPLRLEKFDLGALLKEVYPLIKPECSEKKIGLELETEANLWVEGDRARLKQVFLNVVQNAVEAVGSEGQLRIQSTPTEEQMEVKIIDNGPGIAASDMKKVFTPFFTTKKGGMGLGLAVSKRIIDLHPGSSIGLSSSDKGTTVRIILPRVSPE
ncbi:MAG: PAS domain S-box protein [Deltaproteobacteria bacterium]|nr:PAS domain S-box protein [Deltaproteobacteria bacterium]